ncbi:hypothetical protein Pmani_007354 [Petrolisthes manimaculis]|uniref:Uncharacterized protein n=1 Tax=Petrolisthes manimaculis TaxID=1843537 RepID=A0AAE1UIT6_9EUCA|nr:hypothetical protein Pmani_007354 [Petrolisthes manimaculis]
MQGVYDEEVCRDLFERQEDDRTRGHSKKLYVRISRLNIRKNFFGNRVVENWNDLPEQVITSGSVLKFERALDKVWGSQPVKYDYRVRIEKLRPRHIHPNHRTD